MNVEYLDLPRVDIDMDQIYETIYRGKNLHHVPTNGYYGIFKPESELENLGELLFDDDSYNSRVHVMWPPRLPIHKDSNRFVAYNYVIDPGGDEVFTCFYDEDQNLIEKVKIEPFKWHKLNVKTFHNVEGMTRPRIGLTVYPAEETNWPKPVVNIDYSFNMDLLWDEYNRMKDGPQPDYEFSKEGKTKKNTLKGMAVYGSQDIGVDADTLLMDEARKFCSYFDIEDEIFAQFMWIDKDFNLSWHIDDATRCRSSVNVIMTDDPAPVSFREGDFYYKCAALDVMQEHSVTNKDKERILMRISFKNLTHDKLCQYFE